MQKSFAKTLLTSVAALALATQSLAQPMCSERAMLVFDGSGSMAESTNLMAQSTRITQARRAVRIAMPEITPHRDVGLLIYGPGRGAMCAGIRVAFQPSANAADAIIEEVDRIRPDGLTPLTASIEHAALVLDYQNEPTVIVVVTDGNETCGGRPCAMAEHLSDQSAGLRIHVVGFNLDETEPTVANPRSRYTQKNEGIRCLAERTGGVYVAAQTVEELVAALNSTLGCMLVAQTRQRTAG